MTSPDDRRYIDTHEWHKLENDLVTIGLSRFAVDALTDITYVEIQREEGVIGAGETLGEIESVKATSEIFCGIDGTVTAVNTAVLDDPSIINTDPFGAGWLVKVKPVDAAQIETLMAADAYDAHTGAKA